MKRACLLTLLTTLAVGLVSVMAGRPAEAHPQFKKEFDNRYIKKAPGTDQEKSLAESAKVAKCNVCHKGEKKKDRNSYGDALSKFLTKKDRKDVAKINKALDDVEKMHSKADDPTSPTYGDLIKQGKLPAGEAPPH